MTQQEKQQAIDLLREQTAAHADQLRDIEPRLLEYYQHLCEHSGIELGDENDQHNGMELLCALRLLRLLDTYPLNREKIDDVLYMGEGEWRQDSEGFWTHIQDGLGQPGRQGFEVYRWEPFQVFMIVAMYGPMAWIGTETEASVRRLTETERVNADTNEIEDLRRLCTRFVLFGPRKINKSGFAAITNVEDFMFGDYDAQVVCTANSQEQSKILFNKTKDLLLQLDPVTGRKFNGKYLSYTATEVKFMKGKYRAAELIAIPAGGKMPDGKFASRSAEDEYGSAGYTNGRSDMGQTAAVIESSMGPRREPMTVITTTASLITAGPFMEMLDALHKLLLEELKYATGEATPNPAEDRQMCLLLEPDEWERDDEFLLTSKTIRRKINPMLGKIVQHSFYDDECTKSRMDETKKNETIAKLFNVYRGSRVTKWLSGDQIRPRQVERRIMDCWASQGWKVFCGLDFGGTDDIWAACYFAANYNQESPVGRFFADLDLWITEKAMLESPNRPLYEMWVRDGWLNVCPGEVFSHEMAVNQIMYRAGYDEQGQLAVPFEQQIDIRMFGYDPAQSIQPINQVKAWLQSLGIDAQTIKRMVIPVPQSFVTMNGLVQETEYMLLTEQPWLQLSNNPAWPWMFQNVKLEISPNELKKPLKSSANTKIDGVHALLDGLYCFDFSEGQIQQ